MQKLIERPIDDYDPLWALYNEQNPGLLRAVGADAADDGGDEGGEGDESTGDEGKGDESGGKDDKGDEGKAAGDADWSSGIEDKGVLDLANRYTSRADQAKAHHELVQTMSTRFKVPGKDASDEDVAKYRKATGVPDEAGGYEFAKPEHMEDDVFADDNMQAMLGEFKTALHASGATPAVASAVMDFYWKTEAEGQKLVAENDQKAIEAAEAGLRKEWGKDYDQNVKFGDAFLEKQGATELKQMELKDGSLLGSHPDFIKMTATSGRRIGEGALQVGLNGTEAGQDLEKRSKELAVAVADANAAGDNDKAEILAKERREVNEKLYGKDAA